MVLGWDGVAIGQKGRHGDGKTFTNLYVDTRRISTDNNRALES